MELVEREAQRLRHPATDDGVGPHRPGLSPLQVHGAAATAAEPLGKSADLRQRTTQDGADIVGELRQATLGRTHDVAEGLGEELVMSTMGSVDEVIAS